MCRSWLCIVGCSFTSCEISSTYMRVFDTPKPDLERRFTMKLITASRVATALALLLPHGSRPNGASFDFIFIRELTASLCSGCAITSSSYGFGLVVNTGTNNLTKADVRDATFAAESSVPGFQMAIYASNLPNASPVAPGEVVGSVVSGINDVLLTEMRPSESFRNTTPSQVLAIHMERAAGNT